MSEGVEENQVVQKSNLKNSSILNYFHARRTKL